MAADVTLEERHIVYNDSVVRKFIWASVIWGSVGMLIGVICALQLAFWQLNFGISFLTYSHLRPLHTNAVIFALVGNMMFAGVYYSTQRLTKVRMGHDLLSNIHFWGWQAIILSAVVTLPFGITTSKEYAELEWPIDLAITLIWVVFAVNFFWTLAKRNEKNLYVALWFYISTIVTVAVLHIFNSLEIPVTLTKSYSVYGGVQDALVQWWYGHNAVAFFLTTPILGIMYYFMPKAAERPVYSYRLSIVHFWALVFMYIWAGPHHLLYTALPEWAQSLGMVFSLALWAPSWGGMLNGLLTLRGAWDKVRTDPVLKFLAAGVTFYGMSTFEGPMLSIKSVSGLAHYTDWIIAHVHVGALGWNGFMAAGVFYWLVPRLYGTTLYSKRAADVHFWIGTVGILMYAVAMWTSGVTQGLMWRAEKPDGSLLYPDFVETLIAIKPLYIIRAVGGTLYLVGFLMMAWNLAKTALSGKAVDGEARVFVEKKEVVGPSWGQILTGRPVFLSVIAVVLTMAFGFVTIETGAVILTLLFVVSVVTYLTLGRRQPGQPAWHALLEGRPLLFTVLTLIAVLIGGVAELLPTIFVRQAVPSSGVHQVPYTSLELEGRDVYVKEGCYLCHSQMIRPFRAEKLRYGDPSIAEESALDHPFQWGSKRTGPDLARVGAKYPNLWHYSHMMDPRSTSPGSNMPSFKWIAERKIELSLTPRKLKAMRSIGVPYQESDIALSVDTLKAQGKVISDDLAKQGVTVEPDSEMVALIAYLQRLGHQTVPNDPGQPVAGTPAAPEKAALDIPTDRALAAVPEGH
jgi:cytochrome c oxidase cbb3-type subunit I/II